MEAQVRGDVVKFEGMRAHPMLSRYAKLVNDLLLAASLYPEPKNSNYFGP